MPSAEPVNIFISWSGNDGMTIGRELRASITEAYSWRANVFFSNLDIGLGRDWRAEIMKSLTDADIMVCLIDEQFIGSAWCTFEIGGFVALNKSSDNLYPLVISPSQNGGAYRHGLLDNLQARKLDSDSLLELFENISDQLRDRLPDLKPKPLPAIVGRLMERFDAYWEDRQSETQRNYQGLLESLDSAIEGLGRTHHIPPSQVSYIKTYLKGLHYKKLLVPLKDIIGSYERCRISKEAAISPYAQDIDNLEAWADIWEEFAEILLNTLQGQVQDLASNHIALYDSHHITKFWLEKLLTRTQKSIWTTNMPGTFGRRPKHSFLDAQRKAIERGVEISRVFVYSKAEIGDMEELKVVIEEQLAIGVQVAAIEREKFMQVILDAPYRVKSTDFMIIDDIFVYSTIVDEQTSLIESLRFEKDDRELDWARAAKKGVQNLAHPIRSKGEIEIYFRNRKAA